MTNRCLRQINASQLGVKTSWSLLCNPNININYENMTLKITLKSLTTLKHLWNHSEKHYKRLITCNPIFLLITQKYVSYCYSRKSLYSHWKFSSLICSLNFQRYSDFSVWLSVSYSHSDMYIFQVATLSKSVHMGFNILTLLHVSKMFKLDLSTIYTD